MVGQQWRLWFDVESRYKATAMFVMFQGKGLWFDVESRYKATIQQKLAEDYELWFDVESRYKATLKTLKVVKYSCGLMQNQDIKQLRKIASEFGVVVV